MASPNDFNDDQKKKKSNLNQQDQPDQELPKNNAKSGKVVELHQKMDDLEKQLQLAIEREKRARADYQNLLRRSQDEKSKIITLANAGLMEELLQPLDHLELAAKQLNDQGLNMVVSQFKSVLNGFGLEQIEVLGQNFNLETMEVVERQNDEGEKVVAIAAPGYTLQGQVIRHAKVVIG